MIIKLCVYIAIVATIMLVIIRYWMVNLANWLSHDIQYLQRRINTIQEHLGARVGKDTCWDTGDIRTNELLEDGYEFGEALDQAAEERKKREAELDEA